MDNLPELEKLIFGRLDSSRSAGSIFILGAPRTGSTFLYQAVVSAFAIPFIDNLTNQFFPETPILGLMVGPSLRRGEPITFLSRYGKSAGLVQPSEGSRVMAHWFGGGHPSQVVSARILEGREPHFIATLAAVDSLLGGPLVIKNAWNCFRAQYIAAALPSANFIWIRRDLRTAAKSDLMARYAVQGDPNAWNSATPANVDVLRKKPCWEQVVENQFEFGKALSAMRDELPTGRWVEVWYEDLIADVPGTLGAVGKGLILLRHRTPVFSQNYETRREDAMVVLGEREAEALDRYVESNRSRFGGYLRS